MPTRTGEQEGRAFRPRGGIDDDRRKIRLLATLALGLAAAAGTAGIARAADDDDGVQDLVVRETLSGKRAWAARLNQAIEEFKG